MTTMLFPFNQLNDDTKFAYAVSETFKAMYASVQKGEPVLGSSSDDHTITSFVERQVQDPEIVQYVLNDDTFPHNRFVESIFALYNTFNLYSN